MTKASMMNIILKNINSKQQLNDPEASVIQDAAIVLTNRSLGPSPRTMVPRRTSCQRKFINKLFKKTQTTEIRTIPQNPNNLKQYFMESSVPGLREIYSSGNILRKLCWIIGFFMLSFMALKDIHQLLTEFYMYPISTDVRIKDSKRLPFPSVTVCNLNSVRYSALCNSTHELSILFELHRRLCGIQATSEKPATSKPILVSTPSPPKHRERDGTVNINTIDEIINNVDDLSSFDSQSNSTEEPRYRNKRSSVFSRWFSFSSPTTRPPLYRSDSTFYSSPGILSDEVELTERQEKELQENLTNWLATMQLRDKRFIRTLGHQFEDILLRCTIKATNCTHAKFFESSFTSREGNCFTYNPKSNDNKAKLNEEAILAGVNYGLELVLNLEINEYLPGSAQIGAIVMVHHPDDFGNSASEAIFVAPEQATYIGLKIVNITRLPAPYPEECINYWPIGLKGTLTQNATYSQQACLKICLQMTIQNSCKCQAAMLPQLEMSTSKICDTTKRSTRLCVENVMFKSGESVNKCLCPPRCHVINYEKTVSVAKWPTREDRVTFDRRKANINFQNLAKVVVYFQTMTCQQVTQQAAYTTAKLFSSLGGIMGMYVGFSFLSLFEVFEVLIRKMLTKCSNRKKINRISTIKESEEK